MDLRWSVPVEESRRVTQVPPPNDRYTVPMDPAPTPQQMMMHADKGLVFILVMQPKVSMEIVLDREGALAISDRLRELAGGLQVIENPGPLTVDQILNPKKYAP